MRIPLALCAQAAHVPASDPVVSKSHYEAQVGCVIGAAVYNRADTFVMIGVFILTRTLNMKGSQGRKEVVKRDRE